MVSCICSWSKDRSADEYTDGNPRSIWQGERRNLKYFRLPGVPDINPLRPVGRRWPTRIDLWIDPISPALLGWPARNRHTAACVHRFSHILRWPPEPVVWFMSELRAVANEHEGYKRTLPIISSSFWMAVGLRGLYNAIFYSLYNPLRPVGRQWPTRIDLWIDPISPRRRRFSAGLHATDTLRHAYIDFLTYSDDHPSR